ncbi:phosphorylase family protein [Methyloterricola oryzae]|uniref:phosphorylase family protein n=1 Tax=Methyloterricola oryzae TaxID=1495050 RepID=UPI0005EAF49A|nr:hypothetical protein [Methyloterricola oryzae]
MNRVGIVVALEAEGRTLTPRPPKAGECLALEGGGLLIVSDAGPVAAARAADRLLENGADALVSWGCAAALDPGLRPGDLVLPRVLHGADGSELTLAADWVEQLKSSLATSDLSIREGAIAESRGIVATVAAKAALFAATGALAVDMESAAVARSAAARGLPALVVRSIVDPASIEIPPAVQNAFDGGGHLRLTSLLAGLARRPWEIAGLIQLGWHFRAAMQTLRKVGAHFSAAPADLTHSTR